MKSRDVIDFMARDLSNPSSIISCLRAARENARAVRSSTNSELWETLNTTWLDCQRMLADGILERDPYTFFEWVKFRSHLSRGVQLGTLVQGRRVLVHAPGHFHRTRGQHGAHSRREVFHARAAQRVGSTCVRTLDY